MRKRRPRTFEVLFIRAKKLARIGKTNLSVTGWQVEREATKEKDFSDTFLEDTSTTVDIFQKKQIKKGTMNEEKNIPFSDKTKEKILPHTINSEISERSAFFSADSVKKNTRGAASTIPRCDMTFSTSTRKEKPPVKTSPSSVFLENGEEGIDLIETSPGISDILKLTVFVLRKQQLRSRSRSRARLRATKKKLLRTPIRLKYLTQIFGQHQTVSEVGFKKRVGGMLKCVLG